MINHFDAPDQFDAFDDRDVDLDESNEAPDVCVGCLNKAAIADVLYEKYKIDRGNGKRLASQIFELIINHLKEGHTVKLAGLGNFSVRDKTARPGRNLKTGSLVVTTRTRRLFEPKLSEPSQLNRMTFLEMINDEFQKSETQGALPRSISSFFIKHISNRTFL